MGLAPPPLHAIRLIGRMALPAPWYMWRNGSTAPGGNAVCTTRANMGAAGGTLSGKFLKVHGLTKRYGDQTALDHVTFAAGPGEVIGIIGPNGAGKTTLLETVAGILPAGSGDVFWHGHPMPPSRRREAVFYLPDGVRPYQDERAARVVSFFAAVYRRTAREVAETAASVGLAAVLHKRVSALSKGFARRLMLAIGLLAPHPILLMDEPFDCFDFRQTQDIMDVLRREAATGRCLILAIHQLADAERVCGRFILLADGCLRGDGTIAELRERSALPGGTLEDIFLALT